MGKRLTTKEVIERSKKVHGEYYDYSKTEFIKSTIKIIVICPVHGEFEAVAETHMKGVNCMRCSRNKIVERERAKYKELFYIKAEKVHGCRYDYSDVDYINTSTKIKIKCKKHGVFEQTPNKHLYGQNCPKCVLDVHYFKVGEGSVEQRARNFITKSINKHGEAYSYEKSKYIKNSINVEIFCKKCKKYFWQTPASHMLGYGCHKCGNDKRALSQTFSFDIFLNRFRERYGDKYDYSEAIYTNSSTKIKIKCELHGYFWQTPTVHCSSGCKKCGRISTGNKNRKLPEELKRVASNIRRSFKKYVAKKGYSKQEKTHEILGCNWFELKSHLEDNPYGFVIGQEGIDIDHIVPLSNANTKEEVYLLTHYTNFQLLPSPYNQWIKRDNEWDRAHFEKWLGQNIDNY